MANKFKVGDKVKIVGNEESMLGKSQYFGEEVIVERVDDRLLYPYVLKGIYGWCWDDSELESVYDNYKIVITTDGTITTAKLYDENGKCTKTAEAKCNHKVDTFDFNEGAKLAFDRLTSKYSVGTKVEVIANTCYHEYPIGSVLTITRIYHDEICVKEGITIVTERDIKHYVEPEKPKYYNGKVVCISSDVPSDFTVGKVYKIKDGKFTDNFGYTRPSTSNRITCIEDLNNEYFAHWGYKFIPFVED